MKIKDLKDNVQGMREKILDLAMRGKLVSQDENDEPASMLLEKIAQEKAQLIKEKKIKKTKLLPEITDEEKPFAIPDSWEWVRLGDLVDNGVSYPMADGPFGSNLKKEHYTSNPEVRIIQLSNIGEKGWKNKNTKYTTFGHLKEIERSAVQAGDIVIAKMMPAGRAIEVPGEDKGYVLSSDAVKFVPNRSIDKSFILKDINSPVFQKQVSAHLQGSTRPRTSLKKLKSYLLPLPPLNEQKRIAAKVEELFALIDTIEKSLTKYEGLQEELEDKVLDLAMQGKLVEQHDDEEPASALLEKIKAEKTELIKEKKIKKTKPLPEITDEEKPFDIPENWEWVRLGDLTSLVTKGTTPKGGKSAYLSHGINYYRAENIKNRTLQSQPIKYISQEVHGTELKRSKLEIGDILITIAGTLGNLGIVKEENLPGNTNQAVAISRLLPNIDIDKNYIIDILSKRTEELIKNKKTTSIPNLTLVQITQCLMPLPPLNEQKRIAAKVEELYTLMNNE